LRKKGASGKDRKYREKNREREEKRQENVVSESNGLSSDDGSKMASKNLGIFSAKESLRNS